jgi:hypothetical protein
MCALAVLYYYVELAQREKFEVLLAQLSLPLAFSQISLDAG